MAIRKNVRHLGTAERDEFIQALLGLKAEIGGGGISTYDSFTRLHMESMMRASDPTRPSFWVNAAHRGPAFLPWHRVFLRKMEQELQRISGNPDLGIPYWDWTQDSGRPDASPIWADEFLGGNGDPTLNDRVSSGPFADSTTWPTVIATGPLPGGGVVFAAGPGLRRRMNPIVGTPNQVQVDAVLAHTTYDTAPWDRTVTDTFRSDLEGPVHDVVHRFIGGDMAAGTSPNDPAFYLHHANVDRLWALWEAKHPTAAYEPNAGAFQGHNRGDLMFPWDGARLTDTARPSDVVGLGVGTSGPVIYL